MDGARPFIVALHAGALAAQHRAGQRIAAAAIAAGEAVAGGQRHRGAAPARLGALGIGDALDGAGGVLGFGGHAPAATWPTAAACRRDRGRASSWVSNSSGAMPHTGSSGTARAMSTARCASVRSAVGAKSVEETKAWRWPTNTRRPRSRPSLLSSFSRSPMRWATEIELAVDVERVRGIGAGGLRPFQQVGEQVGVGRARRTLPGRRLPRGLLRGGLFRFGHDAVLRANRPSRRDRSAGQGPA